MRTIIKNQEFPDLYKFDLLREGTIVKYLLKAGSSELSDPDFIETDFRYFQEKLEFGSPDLLNELVETDKEIINTEGAAGIEKYLSTLFPTQTQVQGSETEDDLIEYYSSLTKNGGDEVICLLIPEEVDKIEAFDSHEEAAFDIEFEGSEIQDSKVLWIVTSFDPKSPRTLNLSYEAYKGDRNPVRRMSDYVLRNDDFTENRFGYSEKDGFLYSDISGSLIGTERILSRPIYDLKCEAVGDRWNRARRYSIGDTAKVGDTVFESIETNNIGNHPYYSRMWIKKII